MKIISKHEVSPNLAEAESFQSEYLRTHRSEIRDIVKLPGDASTRQYYRIHLKNGDAEILMKLEAPFNEEKEPYPFLEVQRYLAEKQISVPKILSITPEEGVIRLEDLGDLTLLHHLKSMTDPEEERLLYQRAIDLLVNLQYQCSPGVSEKSTKKIAGHSLHFNEEKLMWEVRFTIEHFYEKYLARDLKPVHKKVMEKEFEKICALLAQQPEVLAHRDLHSRNIMVTPVEEKGHQPRLTLIDFQDARMGPAQYDLASLLRDSYYQLDEIQIRRLLEYYVARWEAVSGQTLETETFTEVFDLMSVQRNFKAIGSFASFLNRRGNAQYLKYIGNTFENVRRTLLRYPAFNELREVLFHYYYF